MPDPDAGLINDRGSFNAAMKNVKATMVVIGQGDSTEALWKIAFLRATSDASRQALRIKDRDCFGDQSWRGNVKGDTVTFVVDITGALRDQLPPGAVADADALGEVLELAFLS